jgi:Leucine-rich repeat (LRR) protein
MEQEEIHEYVKDQKNCVYLKNGLRASTFVNEDQWNSIKDTVDVDHIDIVYSKYPLREGTYYEIYPLLFDRLKALFKLDSDLNDASIKFTKVLQTHCENDDQVRSLYHGIVIHYKLQTDEISDSNEISSNKIETLNSRLADQNDEQSTIADLENAVDRMLLTPYLPDSIKEIVKSQALDEQIETIKEFLLEEIKNEPEHDLSTSSPEEIKEFTNEIEFFMSGYSGGDKIVDKVFSRHPEWKNILVVNDWTGSMYGYGAQILEWHLKNFEKSGIISLTLFNDGDSKPQHEKQVGETGGIYFEQADNIPQLVDLFNFVMLKGGGGDSPENNIEAILKAKEEFPKFSEIVLVADNNACVRDIALADRIGVPVRVILCGYDKSRGVNPHYVYLAKITGGGIYTIEDDLEDIKVDLKEAGEIANFSDKRFKINKHGCSSYTSLDLEKIHTLQEGLKEKKNVVRLDASDQGLDKVPGGVFKMEHLNELNLSKNKLTSISPKIAKISFLKSLNLSENKLSTLPTEIVLVRFLESFKLSNNLFDSIPSALYSMKFLKELDLSHNKLSKFDISTLTKLHTLDLSDNQISEITKGVSKLKQVRYLDLSNNKLGTVPKHLSGLRKLRELDLSGNGLSSMPQDLIRFQHIKVLRLKNNSFSEAEKDRIRNGLKYTQIEF